MAPLLACKQCFMLDARFESNVTSASILTESKHSYSGCHRHRYRYFSRSSRFPRIRWTTIEIAIEKLPKISRTSWGKTVWTVETSHDPRPAASPLSSSSSSPSSWWLSSPPPPRETVLRSFVFVDSSSMRRTCVRVQDAEPNLRTTVKRDWCVTHSTTLPNKW